ncbi:MAG: secretin N-terminal domain-containing protein [Sterolibacterium sp.]|nr:secretin N-terminal domain-containing protein [Sterolibacterium sp.]
MNDLTFFRYFQAVRTAAKISGAGCGRVHEVARTVRNASCSGLLATLLLAGCSMPLVKYGEVNETLRGDMERAVTARTQKSETIDPALMPPLQIEEPLAKAETEARFDLSVVNAPATQVFMALVTGTRYSMLLPPDLSGAITVNLKDVTVLEALDTLRELYGYEYTVKGNRIFIQANTLQTRIFQINYLVSQRMSSSNLRIASTSLSSTGSGNNNSSANSASTGTGGTGEAGKNTLDTSSVSTQSSVNFWEEVRTALNAIVLDGKAEGGSDGKRVHINQMSGVVVVRALPNELRAVESYLKATQLVVERQVMLEAKIISVTLNNAAQTGINWAIFNTTTSGKVFNSTHPGQSMVGNLGPSVSLGTSGALQSGGGLTVNPGKGGSVITDSFGKGFIGLAFQTTNFAALLSFLETQGDVAVLSSPRIATLNNQKALLKVGTDDMFVTNVSGGTPTTTSVAGTPPTVDLQPFFSGISLDVTPQIDNDGNIILHMHPAVSQVTEIEKVIDLGTNGGILKLPQPSSEINESDSIVRVQNGNIVAIGGLMKQQQARASSQLPGTSETPFGFLFGQKNTAASKSEMVILIKPTIVDSDKNWQDDLQGLRERMPAFDVRKPDTGPLQSSWQLQN